jgi:hypothetical protein
MKLLILLIHSVFAFLSTPPKKKGGGKDILSMVLLFLRPAGAVYSVSLRPQRLTCLHFQSVIAGPAVMSNAGCDSAPPAAE